MKTLAIRLGIFSFWGRDGNVFNCKKDGCVVFGRKGIFIHMNVKMCVEG